MVIFISEQILVTLDNQNEDDSLFKQGKRIYLESYWLQCRDSGYFSF